MFATYYQAALKALTPVLNNAVAQNLKRGLTDSLDRQREIVQAVAVLAAELADEMCKQDAVRGVDEPPCEILPSWATKGQGIRIEPKYYGVITAVDLETKLSFVEIDIASRTDTRRKDVAIVLTPAQMRNCFPVDDKGNPQLPTARTP